ncbi:hypothetical protein BN1232_05629 [Mycobacterium lentiflavum]|uniref:Uncharacterized protein n=1 Tax=Mycobacterium lentiflavum TaxID=141349 RepID=A0A0E4H1C3_MYCLN|nr:hypothetical protein BN1232_05629 [Mycobacterium lentiflavum]
MTVWVTVLVSVLGDSVTVLVGGTVVVGTVVVGVSVLGGGAVSVTVWVDGGSLPPPGGWCRVGAAAVVVTVVVGDGVGVVVVAGLGDGEPLTSVTMA